MEKIKNSALVTFLTQNQPTEVGLVDKLKISYRPYICPFNDLLNLIPINSSVFDVGCGSGMFLSLVNQYRSPEKVFGIEISEKLIENAKQLFKNNTTTKSTFKVYNGQHIPEEIKDYNYIVLIDVLHHVPLEKQEVFLTEIYSTMSKNSTLILKDINSSNPFYLWNKVHDFVFSGEIGNEPNPRKLTNRLGKMGFEIQKIEYKMMFLYPHFTLICKKN